MHFFIHHRTCTAHHCRPYTTQLETLITTLDSRHRSAPDLTLLRHTVRARCDSSLSLKYQQHFHRKTPSCFLLLHHTGTLYCRQLNHLSTHNTSTMDCFQDFCLFCDRESTDGPYCSQQCKLADLEKSSNSIPNSPTSPTSSYKLAPAYNFQQQRSPNHDAPTSQSSRPRSNYFMWTEQSNNDARQLTPSSSRTSLSSTSSSTTAGGYSANAKQQLQDYFSSFDQARAAKRRSSLR